MPVGEKEPSHELGLPDLPYKPMLMLLDKMGQGMREIPKIQEEVDWKPREVVTKWKEFCGSVLEGDPIEKPERDEQSIISWQLASRVLDSDYDETKVVVSGARRVFEALLKEYLFQENRFGMSSERKG
jgi:hypothetical protein